MRVPWRILDGLNLYAYGLHNPLSYSDPEQVRSALRIRTLLRPRIGSYLTKQSKEGKAKWKEGHRGERFRTGGYTGPPRASYTKPMAIDAAKHGDFEAAELYENYMCPSCHIPAQHGHTPTDREFNLERYVANYQEAYSYGQQMVMTMFMMPEAATISEETNMAGLSAQLAGEETGALDEAVVANRKAWADLTTNSPSASAVFEPGQSLSGQSELTIIEHGTASDTAAMSAGQVGADRVVLTGVGKVGPDTLAEILAQDGWQGGHVRLLSWTGDA